MTFHCGSRLSLIAAETCAMGLQQFTSQHGLHPCHAADTQGKHGPKRGFRHLSQEPINKLADGCIAQTDGLFSQRTCSTAGSVVVAYKIARRSIVQRLTVESEVLEGMYSLPVITASIV